MSAPLPGWSDQAVEQTVGNLLRVGLLFATAAVAIGAAIYLFNHGSEAPEYRFFRGEPPDLRGIPGIIELVRNRATRVPMAPFNGASPEMAALGKFFRKEGLYTFVRWNTFFCNPPLCISEDQLREAFAIIDRGLALTDKAVV